MFSISDELKVALDVLQDDRKFLLDLSMELLQSDGGSVYPVDLYAHGALNRSLSLSQGFESLLRVRNFACAGAILRLQLDTALRFYAVFLVESPQEFATSVIRGLAVRKCRDRSGALMTDAYLVKQLTAEYSWVSEVYEKTCNFVHLSDTHVFSTMSGVDRESAKISIRIGEGETHLPESTYLDAILAFRESTVIFVRSLKEWICAKNSSIAPVSCSDQNAQSSPG